MFEAIFSSFWTWAGAVILVAVVLDGAADIVKALRKPRRNINVTTYGDRTCIVKIENASEEDLRQVVEAAKERRPAYFVEGCSNETE